MSIVRTYIPDLLLTKPDPERDAVFAVEWFKGDEGRQTLLRMGNPANLISEPTYEGEYDTIEEFLALEEQDRQITWMLRYEAVTIGAAWIELQKNHGVEPPSVHILIGDKGYRGKGIGAAVMQSMIQYLRDDGYDTVYSRHLTTNDAVIRLNRTLGFVPDGSAYTDGDNLEWQNIKLLIKPGKHG